MSVDLKRIDESHEVLACIERLCKLVEQVSDSHHNVYPTDCLCGGGGNWIRGEDGIPRINAPYWRHDPEASIAFIERATQRALNEKKLRDYLVSAAGALTNVVRTIRRNPLGRR